MRRCRRRRCCITEGRIGCDGAALRHHRGMSQRLQTSSEPAAAGQRLRRLRAGRRISQLELSLRVGVSQRHLSCIETGRARASRAMLLALLEALDAPLAERNDTLLAAGFAPAFGARTLDAAALAPAREALAHLLAAHEPAPAVVLDAQWNLIQANGGARRLLALLGGVPAQADAALNLLRSSLTPGSALHDALVNRDEVCRELWHRAQREAAHLPQVRLLLDELAPYVRRTAEPASGDSPLLLARLRTAAGELSFFSTITTFGSPMDITLASLRVEHMFPADAATRRWLEMA
jgi:transcriptional regulator with XRE-family HTH domain